MRTRRKRGEKGDLREGGKRGGDALTGVRGKKRRRKTRLRVEEKKRGEEEKEDNEKKKEKEQEKENEMEERCYLRRAVRRASRSHQ